MKCVRLTIYVLMLLAGFMLWQSGTAEAHGLEKHGVSAVPCADHSNAPQKSFSKQATQEQEIAAASSQEGSKCDGKCCMNSACCSPMAIPSLEMQSYNRVVTFAFSPPLQSLPQGPPYMLLRPPKFSA